MLYFFIGTTVLSLGAFVVTYAVMMKFLWRNRSLQTQVENLKTANKNLMGAYRTSTTEHWAENRETRFFIRDMEAEVERLKNEIEDHFLMPTYKPWQRPAA